MKEKIRKKLVWDDHGVSEIIADILILAMTVVLFAVIFAFVWSLPAPDEAVYADFDSSVRMNEVGGATVNLTHISGEDIQGFYTSMYLIKNKGQAGQDYRQLKVNGPAGEDLDNPLGYGISGDDVWSPSEKWTYYHSSVSSSDNLEIIIVDDKTQSLVFGAKLLGTGINDAPIIMERSYSPEPGTNASTITIVAHVRDPDGWDDISASGSVKVNVSAINSTITYLTLNEVSHTEVSGIFSNSILVDRGQGEYTLTIIAEDTSGTIDRRRINVEIGETASNAPQILERWAIPEVGINGTDITIYARVEDRDGYDNLDWVSIDVGSLVNQNGSSYVVNMSDPEGDGIFVYTASIDVLRGDSYRVNFTAVDITDLQSQAHLNITVNRFNPVIARTWSNPTSGKDEEFMTIYAEVSDPDGYSDISEVLVDLSNLDTSQGWVNMTDPELDGIFEVNMTINVTSGGNKTVTFLARDQTGNDVTATMKVFIATLNAPVILERWTDPALLDNNTQTVIFARVFDADGYDDIDSVTVNISGINQTYNGSAAWFNMVDYDMDGNFVNLTWTNQEAGSYVIEFQATDKGGNVANATLNVTLLAFRPRFLNVWTNPTIGRNGTDIEIFANVMDPNGYLNIANVTVDIIALNQSMDQGTPYWVDMMDYNMNGTFNYTAPINVNQTGLYSLNFTATDVDGNTATINHLLLITSHKPTIIQAWNTPDPAINNSYVIIHAWVWDDDGYEDIKSVRANVTALNVTTSDPIWIDLVDTDNDGIYENLTKVNVTTAGEYWVNITVNDTTGNEYIKSLNVSVVLSAGSVGEDMVFIGDVTPNAVDSLGDLYFTAIAKNGTGDNKKIHSVEFKPQWKSGYYSMDRIFEWFFRYPGNIPAYGTTASNIEQIIYFRARNETGSIIAWHNVTLLILYDKSGGKVNEGTALEQNVAWISNDQGFVITNNKTSNDMIQIFDASDQTEYEKIWIKIGSNLITNTEKANIFQLRSQSTGDVVAQFSSPNYEFVYDGVLAGYWFFVLDLNTTDIYDWMLSESQIPTLGDNTKSEYFDVYMKIKDTTDDFFSTNSWIIVHGGTQGFSAELIAYYDPGYVPGDTPGPDGNSDGFPDDLQRADGETVDPQDDYVFDSIEIVYFRVIMETFNNPPPADFNQFEMIDFKGNRRISSAEGSGPVGSISRNVMFPSEDYMFAVNLLKADKDPWIPGSSAYTCMIKVMSDTDEEFAIVASNVEVSAPTSVMDIVSGRDNVGTGTNVPRYYGDFYENQGGAVWEIDPYAYYAGLTGNRDPYGIIYGVEFEDLDNDDDKDILVVLEGGQNNDNDDPKVVMFDNDGSWTRTDIYISRDYLYSVAAGDLDGDGDLDIVTTDDAGTTYLIENEGAAEFSTIPVEVATGSLSINWDHAIAIGDLDGDFDPGQYQDWGDVVLGSDAGLEIISYDGATWASTTIESGEDYSSVDIADYDGDGDLDIVASALAQGDIYLFEHDGTGDMTFTRTPIVDFTGNELSEVAFGDIDGTDNLDIVVARETEITSYDTNGVIINTNNEFNPSALTGDIVSLQVGNVDGAIQDDVVIATNDGFVYHYRNLGRGTEWLRFEVDDLAKRVGGSTKFYSLAIGDANLGGA